MVHLYEFFLQGLHLWTYRSLATDNFTERFCLWTRPQPVDLDLRIYTKTFSCEFLLTEGHRRRLHLQLCTCPTDSVSGHSAIGHDVRLGVQFPPHWRHCVSLCRGDSQWFYQYTGVSFLSFFFFFGAVPVVSNSCLAFAFLSLAAVHVNYCIHTLTVFRL